MTLKQREQLDNFKLVLSMMYDAASISELVTEKSNIAIVRVQCKDLDGYEKSSKQEVFFLYDLKTGNNSEIYIKDMEILPITKNFLVLEESTNSENCSIKVLDKYTLETVKETVMSISEKHKGIRNRISRLSHSYGYNISKENGYISISVPVDDSGKKNIHGKPINLDYTFTKLYGSTFISNIDSLIRTYDNIEDMNIIGEKKLNTFNGKIMYYPIFNTKDVKANLPQVIFIHITNSDRLYAYNFETKQIHVVKDTRYKVTVPEFIDRLNKCLDTSDKDRKEIYTREYEKFKGNLDKQRDYEKTQFELDCNSLLNLGENKFGFNKITYDCGEYLTLRTLLQCVKEYQRDYNGEVNIRHRYEGQKILNPEHKLRDIDNEVIMSLTPYKIKSMLLIDEIRELQYSKQLGKLIITDEVITPEELIHREELH